MFSKIKLGKEKKNCVSNDPSESHGCSVDKAFFIIFFKHKVLHLINRPSLSLTLIWHMQMTIEGIKMLPKSHQHNSLDHSISKADRHAKVNLNLFSLLTIEAKGSNQVCKDRHTLCKTGYFPHRMFGIFLFENNILLYAFLEHLP